MRLADLDRARVVDGEGRRLGQVHEVHAAGGEITHLGVGPATWLHRLAGSGAGRRIAWSAVKTFSKGTIVVGGD